MAIAWSPKTTGGFHLSGDDVIDSGPELCNPRVDDRILSKTVLTTGRLITAPVERK